VTNGRRRSASSLQVLLGSKSLTSGGQVLNVTSVSVQPNYDVTPNYADMALLRLSGDSRYAPVKLAPTNAAYVGSAGYIAGWGDRLPVTSTDSDYPTRLYSASIPIREDAACSARDPEYNGNVMLCAGYFGGRPDTCSGDSGGPLAVRRSGVWRLVGVTSYGNPGCGSVGTYGVYAWVGSAVLRSWLRARVARVSSRRAEQRRRPGRDDPRRVKVAIVAEYYPRAGDPVLGIWAHRQAIAARAAGAEVRVLALHRPVPSRAALATRDRSAMRRAFSQPRRARIDDVDVRYVHFFAPPRWRSYASWGAWAARSRTCGAASPTTWSTPTTPSPPAMPSGVRGRATGSSCRSTGATCWRRHCATSAAAWPSSARSSTRASCWRTRPGSRPAAARTERR